MRSQLAKHLLGGEAFVPLEKLLPKIPFKKLGERPQKIPYSFYEVFYHVTYAQKDIIAYCLNNTYKAPNWPEDYWPKHRAPKSENEWENIQQEYQQSLENIIHFLEDEKNELNKPVKNSNTHSLLREILLLIEHKAYHTGQLVLILRELNLYDKK